MKSIDAEIRTGGNIYTEIRTSGNIYTNISRSSQGGTNDYNKLTNKPSINDIILVGNQTSDELGIISKAELSNILAELEIYTPKIYVDTSENWDSDPTIRTEEKTIYVYADYQVTPDGKYIAGIKIGDGDAYLIDMPFIDTIPMTHINNSAIHVSTEDREFWDNKVSCYMSLEEEGTLVFTTH